MTLLNGKGQIFSTDLMLASIIFLLILTTATTYGNQVANRIYFFEHDAEMRQAGQQAANGLILTGGNPANWQNLPGIGNVNSIGIADSANMLNKSKIARLASLASSNYEEVKGILGIAKFDFRIEVISMQNNFVVESFGASPKSESSIVSISRIAFYDGNNVVVRLKVFK